VQASVAIEKRNGAAEALRAHWPEYLVEAGALGTFMVSASVFGVLLSRGPLGDFGQRVAAGIAMGLTAVAIIGSEWGKRSGAHMNPAVTLAFHTLGKIGGWDTTFYIAAQFVGGALGVGLCRLLLGRALADVNYVATVPGPAGAGTAFAAEFAISFLLLSIVLRVACLRRTPWVAGALVALFIIFESPLSGMSMNPARTFASAIHAGIWTDFFDVYVLAPVTAMIAAAQLHQRSTSA
jgi:aquaporin Z